MGSKGQKMEYKGPLGEPKWNPKGTLGSKALLGGAEAAHEDLGELCLSPKGAIEGPMGGLWGPTGARADTQRGSQYLSGTSLGTLLGPQGPCRKSWFY